ncbi:hypothetical protein L6164_033714 [Bauhinia variegata]|uniref:Uncharacterized protein n=1 Tax=Bauhinia variegata TaxID=167791 RepID=A0ACB9KSR3_BAUVA|nr:hypothetical protein L6164_033714 [Bauhinia variegata]
MIGNLGFGLSRLLAVASTSFRALSISRASTATPTTAREEEVKKRFKKETKKNKRNQGITIIRCWKVSLMATLCYFSSCFSISSRKLSLIHHHHHHQQLSSPNLEPQGDSTLKHFYVRASSTKKPRRSRKLKSDAELCNDIREFVATVGLPEDHIPSTKELLQHGRNDLANIVRRRGYKVIRDLLASSLNAINTDKSFDERPDVVDDSGDSLTGQNVTVDNAADDVTVSTNNPLGIISGGLDTDSTPNLNDHTCISSESSANSSLEEDDPYELKDHSQGVNNMAEGNSYPIEASVMDNGCSSSRIESDSNAEDKEFKPSEPSLGSSKQKDWSKLEGLDDRNNNIAEDIPSISEVSVLENSISDGATTVKISDDSCINVDPSAMFLEEKVAKFIRSGELDPVEDYVSGMLNGNGSEESKVYSESESFVEMPLRTPSMEHSKYQPKDTAMMLNESSLTSKQVVPSAKADHLSRDNHVPAEDLTAPLDNDLDAEATKSSSQSEINRLKFMLRQKELELSQLKEQIEKEKLALSVLQTKAETEIGKARKLISEKDLELHVAEESLSGLKEVQIQFSGEADTVEVAGSFNGWHHRIEMDPQPSTSVVDPSGSRRSRLWSTVLWLYPGKYEIKFVVDGQWRTNNQMESVTRGHICNNILRVGR